MSCKSLTVTWHNIYSKNCNGRKYAPGCFENAIKRLGNKMLPVYAHVDFVNKSVDPPIGCARDFKVIDDDKLTVQVDLFENAPDLVGQDICLAGTGDTNWEEKDGSGYHLVNPKTYRFNALYPNKSSAFPVSVSMEVETK